MSMPPQLLELLRGVIEKADQDKQKEQEGKVRAVDQLVGKGVRLSPKGLDLLNYLMGGVAKVSHRCNRDGPCEYPSTEEIVDALMGNVMPGAEQFFLTDDVP